LDLQGELELGRVAEGLMRIMLVIRVCVDIEIDA